MNDSQWLMRVENGLAASFLQLDGTSRSGIDWVVGLKHGEATYQVMVRAYLSADIQPKLKTDQEYQAQTVMGYLNDLLTQGWLPDQPRNHVIIIGNPR